MTPSLIDQVRALSGPDREVDYAVHEWRWGEWLAKHGYVRRGNGWITTTPPVPGCERIPAPETYTASVDAVLALIGEKLPGWGFKMEVGLGLPTQATVGHVDERRLYDRPEGWGTAPTPALALLLAFLNAWDTETTNDR